jgi:hypothetical protein
MKGKAKWGILGGLLFFSGAAYDLSINKLG